MSVRRLVLSLLVPAILAPALASAQGLSIVQLSPDFVLAGSGSFTLTVVGAGYDDATSIVRWSRPGTNGVDLQTTFKTGNRLEAAVPAALIVHAGLVDITVRDTASGQSSNIAIFTINPNLMIVSTSPLPDGSLNVPYSHTLAAVGGVQPYTWSLFGGTLPSGVVLLPVGTITGTPLSVGTFTFEVRVADHAQDIVTKFFTLTIAAGPPQITTAGRLPDGTVGRVYAVSLQATGGVPPYTWKVIAGAPPPGVTLLPSGFVTGTPTGSGEHRFMVEVTDQAGGSDTREFFITVAEALRIVTESPLPDGVVGSPYAVDLVAAGGWPPYAWRRILGALPPGLELSAEGRLAGTPGREGTSRFTVQVTDRGGNFTARDYTLTIGAAGPPLTIVTESPLPDATLGVAYTQTLTAANGVEPYQWSVIEGLLPDGLSLTPEGVIQGIPETPGESTFQVRVIDAGDEVAEKVFRLAVNPAELIITSESPLPAGQQGQPYSQTLTATGGYGARQWSVAGGSLPPGLELSSNGTLAGNPSMYGEYSFRVRVVDEMEASDEKDFSLSIAALPLQIITGGSLPDAAVAESYSQTLEATGGVTPHQWTVAEGDVPPGTELSGEGVLAGVPTTAGEHRFLARVTDAASETAEQYFTVNVVAPPPPLVTFEGLPAQTDPTEQETLQVMLSEPYPGDLDGVATLSFIPDATVPADDPAVQFETGGRTASFRIPAGETTALFGESDQPDRIGVQTGSVAGRIVVTVDLFSNGVSVTPDPPPSDEMMVARTVPSITSVDIQRTPGGFEVSVVGFSSPRDLSRATFRFTPTAGSNLQTTQSIVELANLFSTWYQGDESANYGSAFEYVQPFTVQGDSNAIASVSVTLTNSVGDSQTVTESF